MWAKTLIGLIVSLLLMMSLFLNFAYLVPLPKDVYLFIGFVGGFLLWAGIMTYFYCQTTVRAPLKYCLLVFLGSGAINSLFYTGVL